MLDFIELTNTVLAVVLTAAYAYQLFFLAYGIVYRRKASRKMARVLNRYGVIICARNESAVIGDLIASLKQQKYPQQLLDVYVVADNCTDNTAQISRRAGAFVYERYNKVQVGKGYAMDYFFHRLMEEGKLEDYAGFFVFDADNLVDPNFVSEMNNTFTSGEYSAITSYRNSKNFASNWISAGYCLVVFAGKSLLKLPPPNAWYQLCHFWHRLFALHKGGQGAWWLAFPSANRGYSILCKLRYPRAAHWLLRPCCYL